MTVGYPDYQTYPLWRGLPVTAQAFTVTIASPQTVQGYVSSWSSIYLGCTGPANGITVALTFFTDQSQATQLATFGFTVIAGTGLNYAIPIYGNYVVITLSTSQAGNQNVTLTVQPTNIAVLRPTYIGVENRIAVLAASVAATSTNTHLLPAITNGNGMLFFHDLTGSAKLNVRVRRLSEGAAEVDDHAGLFGSAAPTQVPFMSGPRPVSISVFNTDVAAHTYDLACQILAV
jgi:hypothetical protein